MLEAVTELHPRYRWSLPEVVVVDAELAGAGARAGLAERALRLLVGRGHRSAADLAAQLGAPETALHDPARLPDAERFRDRIGRARKAGDRILVVGDFDADGLSGLAILVLALRRLGLDVEPYVPDRAGEGHGLSGLAVEHAVALGRRLLITVDTGSTSVAEVASARRLGVDVLITDHHRVPAQPPDAVAFVNPHRPDSAYPDDRLAGTGVAFKVAQLILADSPGGVEAALSLADLATVGTVADLAPLVGENRAIVRIGLERMRADPRPGLAALMEAAGIAPERLDLDGVAYGIAPRLNAAGRVGEAIVAARLLLADSIEEARPLAVELEAANRTRRELTASALAEAREAIAAAASDAPIVVAGPWSVGVIGLVAGRLSEERGVPAIVASTLGASWRASGRAPAGADLGAALEACGDLLVRFGGHPQAAGCEFAPAEFPALRERLMGILATARASDARGTLRLDLTVPAAEVDYALLRDLEVLAPTGPGNPAPLVGISGLTVSRVRPAGADHTSLVLSKGREVLDGIAFERPDLAEALAEGDAVDLVARLASRAFGGFESLQLEVRDVARLGHLEALGVAPPSPSESDRKGDRLVAPVTGRA